jgi:hypothetical protein
MTRSRWLIRTVCITLLAASVPGICSYAQDVPQADVAVGYSPLYILKGFTIWMNGGSAAVAVNANHWFGVVGDVGGYVGHVPQTFSGETYTFGPRFSYRKMDRIVPFVQALFGGSHFSTSTSGITGGQNQITFAIGGGGDVLLGSKRKFALRLGADYFGIHSSGEITDSARFYVGIVYRIGKRS